MCLGVALAGRTFVLRIEPSVASHPFGLQSHDAFAPLALRAALASGGTACAIPRRAALGAPCAAGQGLRPDRMAGLRSGNPLPG
jgi:hypothetical protein